MVRNPAPTDTTRTISNYPSRRPKSIARSSIRQQIRKTVCGALRVKQRWRFKTNPVLKEIRIEIRSICSLLGIRMATLGLSGIWLKVRLSKPTI